VIRNGDTQAWSVEYSADAARALRKLDKRDRPMARLIRAALLAVAATSEPRSRGKALTGNRAGQWRYRIGDWRVIADIQDNRMVIQALEIGHRSIIY